MKRLFLICIFAAPAFLLAGLLDDVKKEHAAQRRVAELIATADSARVRGDSEPKASGVLILDPAWIKKVSAAVAEAPLARSVNCLCAGWQTAFFYRDGELVASVAAIHGNQIRLYWPGGGGDYPVDAASWAAVKDALSAPGPNPSPEHDAER